MTIPVRCDPLLKRVERSVLKAFQGNLKSLQKSNYDKIKRSLEKHGFFVPVFVWGERIMDGHQRFVVLDGEGWELDGGVPVVEILAESERDAAEKLLVISSSYGHVKGQGLFEYMENYGLQVEALGDYDFPEVDLSRLKDRWRDKSRQDEVPDLPAVPTAASGDVWRLGRHRLICGDATDPSAVSGLLEGESPQLMITDPPYGVEYDAAWRAALGLNADEGPRTGVVENDDRADWSVAWVNFRGAVAYVWHAGLFASEVQESLKAAGLVVRSQIIWGKKRFAISRGHYHWRHEPCWYAVRKGKSAAWIGGRKEHTLWNDVELQVTTLWDDIPLDENVDGGHSTQKPVECMERALRNHEGDVYDPFVGSGTTIIAAENQGRRCFAIELNPAYVDVCVKRWEAYTGDVAVRVPAAQEVAA